MNEKDAGRTSEIDATRATDERIAVEVMGWVKHESLGWWLLPKRVEGQGLKTGAVQWATRDRRWIESDSPKNEDGGYWDPHEGAPRFSPSTDRTAALEVVDRLVAGRCLVRMEVDEFEAEVTVLAAEGDFSELAYEVTSEPPSLPLAISRAALNPEVLAHLKASEAVR